MEQRDFEAAIQTALRLANQLAPTGIEQRGFVALVHAMRDENATPSAVLRAILGAMIDGLDAGNWPTA